MRRLVLRVNRFGAEAVVADPTGKISEVWFTGPSGTAGLQALPLLHRFQCGGSAAPSAVCTDHELG